jgi:hypothetical protein
MKINGRLAADIIFASGASPKVVSLPILARMLIEKTDKVKGSLEIKLITLQGKFDGNKSAVYADKAISFPRKTAYEMSHILIRVVYNGTEHATMKEIYRTARVLEEATKIIQNITIFRTYINLDDDNHMISHRSVAYSDTNQINSGLLQQLATIINDITEYQKYKDEFDEFDNGVYNLDYQVAGVFKALGYDFRKHNIKIREDYDANTVTLTIPEGKSATDKEITAIYNIFKEYVYPEETGRNPNYTLILKGELIHTKKQPWESDPNFKIIKED